MLLMVTHGSYFGYLILVIHTLYSSEILKSNQWKIEVFGNEPIFSFLDFVLQSEYIFHSGMVVSQILEAVLKKADRCCAE